MADIAATGEWIVLIPIALCCGLPLLLALFMGKRRGPPNRL
jgi:hypothetical protein